MLQVQCSSFLQQQCDSLLRQSETISAQNEVALSEVGCGSASMDSLQTNSPLIASLALLQQEVTSLPGKLPEIVCKGLLWEPLAEAVKDISQVRNLR